MQYFCMNLCLCVHLRLTEAFHTIHPEKKNRREKLSLFNFSLYKEKHPPTHFPICSIKIHTPKMRDEAKKKSGQKCFSEEKMFDGGMKGILESRWETFLGTILGQCFKFGLRDIENGGFVLSRKTQGKISWERAWRWWKKKGQKNC